MRCEVCGRRIFGKSREVVIEGAKMVVCGSCSGLGTIHWKATPSPQRRVQKVVRSPQIQKQSVFPQALELVEDFHIHVRQARDKLGLSLEDLGKKIGEKVSVLKKIESGKMSPDHKLANKLQHALRITLLIPFSEPDFQDAGLSLPRQATLGEIVYRKGKKPEVTKERT